MYIILYATFQQLIVQMHNLQHKIDKLIERKGLVKSRIAEDLNISRTTVYNLNENTSIGMIVKLCKYLEVDLCELLYNENAGVVSEPAGSYGGKNTAHKISLRSKKIIEIDLKNFSLTIK